MVCFLARGCLDAAFFSTLSFSLSCAFHFSKSSSESESLKVGYFLIVDCFLIVGFLWGPSWDSDLGEFTVSSRSYAPFDSRLLDSGLSSALGLNKRFNLLLESCFISLTALSFGLTDLLFAAWASFLLFGVPRFRFRGTPSCDPGRRVLLRLYWSKLLVTFFFFFFLGDRDRFSFLIWSLIAFSLKLSLASAKS